MMQKLSTLFFIGIAMFTVNKVYTQQVQVVDLVSREPASNLYIKGQKEPDNEFSPLEYAFSDENGFFDLAKFITSDTLFTEYRGASVVMLKAAVKNGKLEIQVNPVGLKSVSVVATAVPIATSNLPQVIEKIDARKITEYNQQNTADMLVQTGKISVQKSQQGGGSPILRGFEANRILITVDGVRMNNAIFRSGHLQNVIRVDQYALESADVLFGPGTVIYGSDALGGVLHFRTISPDFSYEDTIITKSNLFTRFSSANLERTIHADVSFSGRRFSSFTSFTISGFEDLRSGAASNPFYDYKWFKPFSVARVDGVDIVKINEDSLVQKGSAYLQYDFIQKLRLLQNNQKFVHNINIQFSNTTNVPRYDRLTEVNNAGIPKNAEWYYGPETRFMASYQIERLKSQRAGVPELPVFGISYQFFEESRNNRRFGDPKRREQREQVNAIQVFGNYYTRITRKSTLRYGVDGTFNYVDSKARFFNVDDKSSIGAGTRYPNAGSYYYTASAYVFYDNSLANSKWNFYTGIRANYVGLTSAFSDTVFFPFPYDKAIQNNAAVNGSAGIAYKPNKSWKFSALFSTGFRAPNVDDVGKVFDSSPGTLIVPNPDVKPEYAINGELTIEGNISRVFHFDVNGFITYAPGLLAVLPSTYNGQDSVDYDGVRSKVYTYQNAQDGLIAGASFGMLIEAGKHFEFLAQATYTYGRANTGDTVVALDHIPPFYGKVAAKVKVKRFSAEVFSLFNGWKNLDNYSPSGEDNLVYATPEGMPAWFTLNLRCGLFFGKKFQTYFGVDNILDTHYRTFASGISAPGRNFYITLRTTI